MSKLQGDIVWKNVTVDLAVDQGFPHMPTFEDHAEGLVFDSVSLYATVRQLPFFLVLSE